MTARSLVVCCILSLALAPAPAQAKSKAVKRLQALAQQLAGVREFLPPDEPRMEALAKAIEEVGAQDDAEAAKTLLALLRFPCKSASVEVVLSEGAADALASMESPAAHDVVRTALRKGKKDPETAASLSEIVGAWPEPASGKVLGELVRSKNPAVVIAGARGLAKLRQKEGLEDLVEAFGPWQERGGEPINAIGEALYEITGLALRSGEDWKKWWRESGKTWDPSQRKASGDGATSERPKHFQKKTPPSMFEGLPVSSKKVIIIMDVSGSMHIRQYVREEVEEAERGAREGTGTSLAGSGDRPPKLNFDPTKDGYKKKPCTFSQCPGARGTGPECPSDENLPLWFSRMKRLSRAAQRLVDAFSPDTEFQMIAFSTEARTWKGKKLVRATASNKEKAKKWLAGLQAGGFTNTMKAMELAFTIPGADTLIFVTDGAPTNPAGRPYPPERWRELLDKIKRLNKRKKWRIDVVAIAEGHTDFATSLAEENGGSYTVVD
ncbi:MAG: hypothetical protein D6731_07880 [Planctomycetota bacterium]|nr:MAG: hypothetical protein D6731_07880 [Planctomycetota bacterium]